ncbi:MAG: hypothetical protein NT106_07295 [Candidatus Sumerlaeota bacterium]|nr:hypothetical protein [Candidatus Sumerlaeota bacterium]
MTHDTLVNLALGSHFAILGIAVVCFFKCADRTAMFKNSFENHSATMLRIKERIYVDLSLALKPLFAEQNEKIVGVLDFFEPGGEYWQEEKVNTQETEAYRNAIMRFLTDNVSALADFKDLNLFVARCKYWAGYLRWGLLIVFGAQLIQLFIIGVIDKTCGHCFGDNTIITLILVSVIFIGNCFLPLPLLLYYHGKADAYGSKYD